MKANTVYVTTNLDDENLWTKEVRLQDPHWINKPPKNGQKYKVRLRYRGPLIDCLNHDNILTLSDDQRGLAAGQSAVIYNGDRVLGGGIMV